MLTGEVAAVEAAIERAKESIADRGMFLDSLLLSHIRTHRSETLFYKIAGRQCNACNRETE